MVRIGCVALVVFLWSPLASASVAPCERDAFACEARALSTPVEQLRSACGSGDVSACVALAEREAGLARTDGGRRSAIGVLAAKCAEGFHAACGLWARHSDVVTRRWWTAEAKPAAAGFAGPAPTRLQLELACAADEPLSCRILNGAWDEWTRLDAVSWHERRRDPDDWQPTPSYEPMFGKPAPDARARADAALGKAVAAGSVRARLVQLGAPRDMDDDEPDPTLPERIDLCARGLWPECVLLHAAGFEDEVKRAIGGEDAKVKELSTAACVNGDRWACRFAIRLVERTWARGELARALRKAWRTCGSGCCWPAQAKFPECEAAVQDLGAEAARESAERGCRTGDRDECSAAARLILPTDAAEARRFAVRGCELGETAACELAVKAGAPESVRVRALAVTCGDDDCALLDLPPGRVAWLADAPSSRGVLERRCLSADPRACLLLAHALSAGVWGVAEPDAALEAWATACEAKSPEGCEALLSASDGGGEVGSRASELLCFVGVSARCAGVAQPRVVSTIEWSDASRSPDRPHHFNVSGLAVHDGFAYRFSAGGGYMRASLATGRVVERVASLEAPVRNAGRPGGEFEVGWMLAGAPQFLSLPDGPAILGRTSVSFGTWGTSREVFWPGSGGPVSWSEKAESHCGDPVGVPGSVQAFVALGSSCGWSDDRTNAIELRDVTTGRAIGGRLELPNPRVLAVARGGRRLLVHLDGEDSVRLVEWPEGRSRALDDWFGSGGPAHGEFSPDGTRVVVQTGSGHAVWDVSGAAPRLVFRVSSAAGARFSPDGRWLAVFVKDGVQLLDGDTGARRGAVLPGSFDAIVFPADGASVVLAGPVTRVVALRGAPPPPEGKPIRFKKLEPPVVRLPEERTDGTFSFSARCGDARAGVSVKAVPSKAYAENRAFRALAKKLRPWSVVTDADGRASITGVHHGAYDLVISKGTCRYEREGVDFVASWGDQLPNFTFGNE